MRKILIVLSIILLLFTTYIYAQEQIIDYSENSLPILNAELRKSGYEIRKINTTLTDTTNTAKTRYVYFLMPDDTLTTGADKLGRIYMDFAGTIQQVDASVKTAPTGTDLIADINLNNSTIWSTQANRITIAATANTGTQSTFNTDTFASSDYFTIDIDQVGNTTAGAKLVVRMKVLSD